MATSLYELSVPTFLQTVKAVGGFLDRAVTYCSETGADPDDFVHARLFDDMAPFHFQIEAAWHHSVWGLEAMRTGVFDPPELTGPVPFANLRAMIGKAETALKAFTPDKTTQSLSPQTMGHLALPGHASNAGTSQHKHQFRSSKAP